MRRLIREIHRRSVWQVLGVYLVGAWFGYEVVLALTDGVGLPSWVPPFAIVLFVIGLPIVVATAIVQEGHPLQPRGEDEDRDTGSARSSVGTVGVTGLETTAQTVGGPEATAGQQAEGADPGRSEEPATREGAESSRPAERPVPWSAGIGLRFLTWNRAITAGVLAFALLGLAATGFLGMRTLGIGPAATLVSSGALEERPRVVLAEIDAEDEAVADVVTEALRIDLHESTAITLADAGYVADVLRRMQRDPSAPLTPETAREVAQREGLAAVIRGEVRELGGRYVLSARIEAADGATLAAFREEAADESSLLDAVDGLSTAIREKVGESLRSVRRSEPLEAVTTSSLEALRLYSQGVKLADRTGDHGRAAELFQRAVETDSTFAMAWRKLGVSLSNSAASETLYGEAYRRAYELRDRLTEQERYLAEAGYFDHAVGDQDAAAQAYRTLLELNPDHTIALNNLSLIYADEGRYEEAAALMRRATQLEGDPLHYGNLAASELGRGNVDAADSAVAAGLALEPGYMGLLPMRMAIANARRDYDALEAAADSLEAVSSTGPPSVFAEAGRAVNDGVHGRLGAAQTHLRTVEERARRFQLTPILSLPAILRAAVPLVTRGDTAETLRRVEEALASLPLHEMGPRERPYLAFAGIQAWAGDPDGAEALVERSRRDHEAAGVRFDEDGAHMARAAIARVRGDLETALREVRMAEAGGVAQRDANLERGLIYERAERPDSAIAAYQRSLEPGGVDAMFFDLLARPFLLQRLAELHDDLGNAEQAAEYYARFVELWEDADPELQPRVEAARRRLAALVAEGG
jgi:tetratricopeptide (TPR) repeat protein